MQPSSDVKERMINMLKSVVTYPERGQGGNNKYRGNCSPKLVRDLINFFQPKKFFDPMVGSGTSIDVCRDLGIDHVCLDLNPAYGGYDALADEVPESSDLIFWHPPYHTIVQYSGNAWGTVPDVRDLSRCTSYDDFIKKINLIEAKLVTSLRKGGHIAILVGDVKKNGRLYPIQKDMAWYGMPVNALVKLEHNCWSDNQNYTGKFIPIVHEYCIILKRSECYILPIRMVKQIDFDLRDSEKLSWRDIVLAAMIKLGGKTSLDMLYKEIEGHKRTRTNRHWKEKIRQVVQEHKDFVNTARGEYAIVA